MATASVSYTFVNGTTNDGAQVTQNFTDVVNFLNNSVVHKDGSVTMTGALTLPGSDPTTANQAARKAYVDSAVPVGSLMSYIGSTTPNSSWVLCNGSAISRTTYSSLFTVIGTTYGVGDGATTFNVPDLRGRVPVGFGQGTGLTNRTMAASGGSEALASHNHSTLDAGYGSTVFTTASSTLSIVETAKAVVNSWSYQQVSFNGSAVTGSTGAGSSGNMQPFVVVNFIIKVL